MTDAKTHGASPFKNPLVIALLGSVLLNGILLGLTLAPKPTLSADTPPARSAQQSSPRYEDLPRYLRGDQRRTFDRFVRETYGPQLRQARETLAEERHALGEALRAEPYNQDAVTSAMAGVRDARAELAQVTDLALNDFTAQLDSDARAQMLRRLSRRDRKEGRRDERRGPKRPQ